MIYDYSFRNRLILCKEETFIISLKFKTGNEKPKTVPQKHKTQDTPKLSCLQYSTVVEHTCLAYTALHVYSQHTHACMRMCAQTHRNATSIPLYLHHLRNPPHWTAAGTPSYLGKNIFHFTSSL